MLSPSPRIFNGVFTYEKKKLVLEYFEPAASNDAQRAEQSDVVSVSRYRYRKFMSA